MLRQGQITSIASGQSLSPAIDIGELGLIGLIMPSAWDAAALTFAGCLSEGGTYLPVYDQDGNELTVQAAASRYIVLNPADFAGLRFLKIRSGTVGSAVTQSAGRSITVVTRPI